VYITTQNTQNNRIVTAKQATAIRNFFNMTEVTSGNNTHNKNKSGKKENSSHYSV
jgi:hypothetical protein